VGCRADLRVAAPAPLRVAVRLSAPIAAAVTATLGVFATRRLVFVAAAVAAKTTSEEPADGASAPSVCLIVPARNESAGLDAMLETVAALEREPDAVVLVDDGSSDATPRVMERWANRRQTWSWLRLEPGGDKAAALNAGIAAAPLTDLVATCDADVRLEPGCLRRLVRAFEDTAVGAASGLLWPDNEDESLVSSYCALELWQHQLVTSAAKERLGLGPPAHGGLACYRHTALEQAGCFQPGSLGEDVQLSAALLARGWHTRFVPDARVHGRVPVTVSDYTRQHVRWARGLHAAAPRTWLAHRRPILRIEGWLHAAGYVDRPLLVAAAGLALVGALPWAIPLGYLVVIGAEAVCALHLAGELHRMPRFAIAGVAMIGVDLAIAVSAHLTRTPSWHSPRT
jgi:cellulose synthase/poly-beta-1,6-N-acetylglucosamine synthase-like glycosyltransferase